MKIKGKRRKLLLCISSIGISSSAIAFIPLGDFNGSAAQAIAAYAIGAVFWICTILGYSLLFFLNRQRKIDCQKMKTQSPPRFGIISFFRNTYGRIADVLCAVSLIGVVISMIFAGKDAGWITYSLIAVFIFSFQMHSILNGENFEYIKQLENKSGGSKNVKV